MPSIFPRCAAPSAARQGTLILEYIEALPTERERALKRKILADFEMAAARASVPNDGAEQMIHALKSRGVRIGILTRNTLSSVMASLSNFTTVSESDFQVIITRESEGRPKPHPDGVLGAARQLGVRPRDLLMVGDFVFDIAAGKAAGAPTVLLTNGRTPPPTEPAADYTIGSLAELAGVLGWPPVG